MNQDTTSSVTTTVTELEAFCPVCPSVEEVSGLLAELGYRLVFQLSAQPERDHLPPLPAQYHYRHVSGAEAIFLAGQDSPLHTGVLSLPAHASRFWLSRGGEAAAFQLAHTTLALRWHFHWQEVRDEEDEVDEDEEVA